MYEISCLNVVTYYIRTYYTYLCQLQTLVGELSQWMCVTFVVWHTLFRTRKLIKLNVKSLPVR